MTKNEINKVIEIDALSLMKDVSENYFDIVLADPPYNIGKNFGNDSDMQTPEDYWEWSMKWIDESLRVIKPQRPLYIYGYPENLAHIAVKYPTDKQRWLVWHYTNKTVPKNKFWQRSHESILCLWKGNRPDIYVDDVREEYTDTFLNSAAGKVRKDMHSRFGKPGKDTIYNAHPKGALPRDVIKVSALAGGAGYAERWFYCNDCDKLCEPKEKNDHMEHDIIKHPTQKPSFLTEKLIKSGAKSGDNILIPFAGSGSECVVAKSLGINFMASEINPSYVKFANTWIERGKIRD